MAARFFLLETIKQKGGHHQDKKYDYLTASPPELGGIVLVLLSVCNHSHCG